MDYPFLTKSAEQLGPHDFLAPGQANPVMGQLVARCVRCGLPSIHPIHDEQEPDPAGSSAVDPGAPSEVAKEHTGSMVALFPSTAQASQIAVPGGEDSNDLHVTLAYLPQAPEGDDVDRLKGLLSGFAAGHSPLSGSIGGKGTFPPSESSDGKKVSYAPVDLPGLPEVRQRLVDHLNNAGFKVADNHGFTPHMTLKYGDDDVPDVPHTPVTFDHLSVALGNDRHHFPLAAPERVTTEEAHKRTAKGKHRFVNRDHLSSLYHGAGWAPGYCVSCGKAADDPDHDGDIDSGPSGSDSDGDAGVRSGSSGGSAGGGIAAGASRGSGAIGAAYTFSREAPLAPEDVKLPAVKAFFTEVNNRTVLTAPAYLPPQQFASAMTENPHFLWMAGRFVGGEQANRNGAFWTTSDLEKGQSTVRHGPLNWLHEGRHIIGTIADQAFIKPDSEQASDLAIPHIAAVSAAWKWIYPDECQVIEMANDAGKLWYSMECISANVECWPGDGGCGAKVPYMDYMRAAEGSCVHMAQRSSTRRFEDPIFLGAAVIVPPVRPGWGDADMRLMKQAASYAEQAYEQAGQPDMSAVEWELLMTRVVEFASS